jgi:RNA polymerase sigma factor (sigma-70 family)
MANSNAAAIEQDLRRLFEGRGVIGLSEAQILDRIARRDVTVEAAFEAILMRHGPAVLACCRRVLGDHAAAEDAFQTTFLVLFQRAGSIRVEESLAPWLMHVARLAALKARQGETRRRTREHAAARPETLISETIASDLRLLVRAQVDRLPAKYRDPVRLCYFEGLTHDDAALALGWPVGTVRGRLSRARDMLRKRFIAQGLGITPLALSAMLASSRDARAELSQALSEAALAATIRGAAIKASVLSLAAVVGRSLAVATAVKTAAVILAFVTLISAATGIAVLAGRAGRISQPHDPGKGTTAAHVPGVDRYGDPLPKGAIARLGTTRFRHHGGSFNGDRAFLTPDGKTLVTSSADGEARAWEVSTGRLLRSIDADEAALSPDGKTLFAAKPGMLRAVTLSDGRELRRVETGPGVRPQKLVIAPNGKHLAFLSQSRSTLIVYDTATLSKKWWNQKDAQFARDIAVSRDGQLLALAGPDAEEQSALAEPKAALIRLFDAAGGAELRRIAIEGFGVGSVVFAPDGKTLAAGVGDRTIRLYHLATGQERLPRLGGEGALPQRKEGEILYKGYDKACAAAALAFSPDGSLLASGAEGIGWFNHMSDVPPIMLWNLAAARMARKLAGHPIGTISLAFTPDAKTLVSSGYEPTARLWDVASGHEVEHRAGHSSNIVGLVVSPVDGTVFTFSLADGTILHWNPTDGRLLDTVGVYSNVVNNLAISPDGRALLLLDSQHAPVLWDVAGRKELRRLANNEGGRCGYAAFSPDGRTVTGNHRVWDVATGRLLVAFTKGEDWCMSSYSADGRQVITVDLNGVCIWDIETAAKVRRLIQGIPTARNAAISPDGRLVAVGPSPSAFGQPANPSDRQVDPIRVWELASGEEVLSLYGHTAISSGMAFSPDGRTLASISGWDNPEDAGLRIWDVASGKPLKRFTNGPDIGVRIAYLPDGRSIVTAGKDGLAVVWDVSDLADRRPPELPDPNALEALWLDLASDDAPRAYRASWALSVEGALPFLRDRLSTTPPKGPKSGPEVLRSLRAIAAIERIGTGPARKILRELARGEPATLASQDAKAAVLRVSRTKTRQEAGAKTN